MVHWYLLSGNNPMIKSSNIERDKFDVFSKSFLDRLIWYYTQHMKKLNVLLPEVYDALSQKLIADYKDVTFNVINATALKDDDYCAIIDSRHVLCDKEWIESVNVLKPIKGDFVRVYTVGKLPVAIIASAAVLKKIINLNDDILKSKHPLEEVIALLKAYFETISEIKIKKKHIISIKSLLDIQNFMSLLNRTKLSRLMEDGVLVWDMYGTWVEPDVKVGTGTVIYPGTILRGDTEIGAHCIIGPSARIENSILGREIAVKDSTIISSKIDDYTSVGPYAYLRPKSDIGKNVKIGDFVEVKNARIDDGSKVSHLSYIGDGSVGKDVNIGCGTVFVNYDGKFKHKTIVEDAAFIGCNSNLIAPVTIKKGAYVAAGSTITDDVQAQSLAIARARQVEKKEWMAKKKQDK